MGDITEDFVWEHQQQSTEDKTELCIGVQPANNDKMGGSKQELVVTIHKMVEIEDRSEFCISEIVQVDEESIKNDEHFTTIAATRAIKQKRKSCMV